MAPATIEAEVDDLIAAVAERRAREVRPADAAAGGAGRAAGDDLHRRLRHFRGLHAAASDPAGSRRG
jgi:DNA polymerase-3 subunit delta